MSDTFVPVTFVADELLTSTKMNQLAANQSNFHNGTGLGNGIIVTRHLDAGMIVQVVPANFSGAGSTTTIIPYDDTKPQSNEGGEFMTISITPKSSTNRLFVEATINLSPASQRWLLAALFKDAGVDALAANVEFAETAGGMYSIPLRHDMVAGTTSAVTFKVRGGQEAAGTCTFNGVSGTRRMGGATISSMNIIEYKA